ncbi:hypothetical protein M440DRAFT_1404661 [Trichoderma longibrachiatum ATCC 18648]|uniref:Heterokaryon incompatibility domain-containing protein n=1 Tax=Trichoderma longibrachiatum ATCC 18648 TaxID=983965 RepID=A0A2T4BWH3_TRILO|nr:hypothetical protein M440DRAFT_1404661 [Trichoderma longibrachiatum ATCC 18648]
MALKGQLTEPASHVEVLDEWYSRLLECHFQPNKDEEDIVEQVCDVIERSPQVADEFHDALVDRPYVLFHADYFLPDSGPSWETLRVTNFVSRNVLRLAIQIQIIFGGNSHYGEHFRSVLDTTAEVLREVIRLSREDPWPEWFIVKAFFWTSWQKETSLFHYYVLQEQLLWGYDHHRDNVTVPLDGSDIVRMAERLNKAKTDACHPPYICRWALRLLREDKAVVGQDYRRFFDRLSQTFSNKPGRCVAPDGGEPGTCDGRQPGKCLRLSGMQITNQSAHAPDCDGNCSSLYWNEESWRGIGGAAAVSLDLGTDGEAAGLLSHRQASRPGDAVIIWSLLCGDTVFDKAEDIWRNQQRRGVPSGWLVSSYERLSVQGFSWAPSRPNFSLHGEGSHADYDKLLLPYHGVETRIGLMTERGLHGDWWAYKFRVQRRTALDRVLERLTGAAVPLEKAAVGYLDGEAWCALLRPLHAWRRDVWVPHPRRLSKAVFAVVGSDDGSVWRWEGVLELDEGVALPQFKTMEFLIQ